MASLLRFCDVFFVFLHLQGDFFLMTSWTKITIFTKKIFKKKLAKGSKKIQNSKCKLFPKGGRVDPKVYIMKKWVHSEKRLQNVFLKHKNVFC